MPEINIDPQVASAIRSIEKRVEGCEHVIAEQFSSTQIRLTQQFDDINDRLNALNDALVPTPPDRAELYKALVASQLEIKNADQNVENEFLHSKYADLASVMDAVREPLAQNGLAIIQLTEDESQSVLGIRTILAHESGQTVEDVITMAPPKIDPQGIGSCRTYMRRYAVLAMCGIAGAIDDDAEGARKDPDDYERITVAEVEKIIFTADELFGDRADAAVAKMLRTVFGGIQVIGDIKSGEADVALKALSNAKELMDKVAKKKTSKKSPKPPENDPPTTEGKAEPGADG